MNGWLIFDVKKEKKMRSGRRLEWSIWILTSKTEDEIRTGKMLLWFFGTSLTRCGQYWNFQCDSICPLVPEVRNGFTLSICTPTPKLSQSQSADRNFFRFVKYDQSSCCCFYSTYLHREHWSIHGKSRRHQAEEEREPKSQDWLRLSIEWMH